MRELIVAPLIKFWPVLIVAAGGIWNAAGVTKDVQANTTGVSEVTEDLKEHSDDAIDRLARIETKLDLLVENN